MPAGSTSARVSKITDSSVQFQLGQARQVIRAVVMVIPQRIDDDWTVPSAVAVQMSLDGNRSKDI